MAGYIKMEPNINLIRDFINNESRTRNILASLGHDIIFRGRGF
jgi:hypothetical protein